MTTSTHVELRLVAQAAKLTIRESHPLHAAQLRWRHVGQRRVGDFRIEQLAHLRQEPWIDR